MLLTSSQVSVAISCATILLFTAALFLSGYTIQQRTLRNLRDAIKPKPRPKIFLPDRFRSDTTELEDGTVVLAIHADKDGGERQAPLVEVRPSIPEGTETAAEGVDGQEGGSDAAGGTDSATPGDERVGKQSKKPDPQEEKPISRAERRRRIKEEIRRLSQADEPVYYQRRLW